MCRAGKSTVTGTISSSLELELASLLVTNLGTRLQIL